MLRSTTASVLKLPGIGPSKLPQPPDGSGGLPHRVPDSRRRHRGRGDADLQGGELIRLAAPRGEAEDHVAVDRREDGIDGAPHSPTPGEAAAPVSLPLPSSELAHSLTRCVVTPHSMITAGSVIASGVA